MPHLARASAPLVGLVGLAAAISACATASDTPSPGGDASYASGSPGDPGLPPPRQPDYTGDASSLSLGNRPVDGGDAGSGASKDGGARPPGALDAAAPPVVDAGAPPVDASAAPDATAPSDPDASDDDDDASTPPPPPPRDSGEASPPDACPNPLGAGDLAVTELMIQSVSSGSDSGEWIEIQNTHPDCSLNLSGLHVAVTSSGATADVTGDLWIPANGIFVVADSTDPSVNHELPSPIVLGFAGAPSDTLEDDGDTLTLTTGGASIYGVTYPAFVLYAAVSISFPADCPWSDITSWQRWSYSANVWTSGFQGTPNADNTDVTCY